MKRIGILIFFISLFVLIGCQQQPSEKVLLYQENKEIIGAEKDEIIGEFSDTIYESIDRSNSDLEVIMVNAINAEGKEVTPPEGRYTISGGQSGRVTIVDEQDTLLYHGVLDSFQGVGSVTVDLNGAHKVLFDGVESAALTPVDTEISTELQAGIWEVGQDIEAGTYGVYDPNGFGFGDLQIFEEGKSPRLFEILNSSEEEMIEVELKDGQKLRITGLSLLQFEPQS